MQLPLRLSCLCLVVILARFGYALETGWHKPLIGRPLLSRNVPPVFIPAFNATTAAERSLSEEKPWGQTDLYILTATSSNVFAALKASNGDIAWRHVFEPSDPILLFRSTENATALLTGVSGSNLRLFSSINGHLLWEKSLHKAETAHLSESQELGVAISFSEDDRKDVFVLTDGQNVRRLKGVDGSSLWEWKNPGELSATILTNLHATPNTVVVYGLTKSFASWTIHVVVLDAETGVVVEDIAVPSSTVSDPYLVRTGPTPSLVWLEEGYLKSFTIPHGRKPGKPKTAKVKVDSVSRLHEGGYFVTEGPDRRAEILRILESGEVERYSWIETQASAVSIFTGWTDAEDRPHFAQISWSSDGSVAKLHTFIPHLSSGQKESIFSFPYDSSSHGDIVHTALFSSPSSRIPQLLVTTSTGSIHFYAPNSSGFLRSEWTREESLAEIVAAEFVDLPEQKTLHSHLDNEGFITRFVRHVKDLQNLPSFIVHFATRFSTGSYESLSSIPLSSSSSPSSPTPELFRDPFNFHKLLVAITSAGKIFALDSTTGSVVWSRLLDNSAGYSFDKSRLFVLKSVWEESGGENGPEIALLLEQSVNYLDHTIVLQLNALTGLPVANSEAQYFFDGSVRDAFLLRSGSQSDGESRTVVAVDENFKVHLFPSTSSQLDAFSSLSPRLHFVSQFDCPEYRIVGFQLLPRSENAVNFQAYETWTVSFPPEERIQTLFKRPHELVASYGKVLGDRSTLYKYLNPHLTAVATTTASTNSSTIYLIDSTKGTIVYRVVLEGARDVHVTLTENWLVYHYFEGKELSEKIGDESKGWRIVSVELYEGKEKNDKTSSPDLSSYSHDTTKLSAFETSFVFPHGITTFTTTSTKFGITMKDLIVATDLDQIQSFPRRFLDPRRPRGKPTAAEQEEMLMTYDPVLPDDPKRVLSQDAQILGITHIITTPTLLESTSLILTYGLDLFLTRVSPSNTFDILSDNFNKVQLVLTIVGLTVAIVVVRPMVRRKGLRQRWYS